MNVLKALALIIYIQSLHVTLLSKITPRYFTSLLWLVQLASLYSRGIDHIKIHCLHGFYIIVCILQQFIQCRARVFVAPERLHRAVA
jgi:hypothetical protein